MVLTHTGAAGTITGGVVYSLTTSVSPSGGGTVSPSCPSGCPYGSGPEVAITATPSSGYQLTGFSGADRSSGSTAYVTINGNRSVTANFALIAPPKLTITSGPQFNGTAGVLFSVQLTAGGGVPPYNWSVVGGSPSWLALTAGGLLSGTPPISGSYGFTVMVTDAATSSASQGVQINVPFTITGQVTQPNGAPLSGVTMQLSQDQTATATTDANGVYAFRVPAGNYLVTPSTAYGRMYPPSTAYSGLASDMNSQGYRVKPFSKELPTDDPVYGVRPNLTVPNNNQPTTYDFWWNPPSINAQNVSSCYVQPSENVTARPNLPLTPDSHFTITFTAQPAAQTNSYRDIHCVLNGRDIVGMPTITVVQAPTADSLQLSQAATPDAVTGQVPGPNYSISNNTNSAFATKDTAIATATRTGLVVVLLNSGTVTITVSNVQPAGTQIRWQADRDTTDTIASTSLQLSGTSGAQTSFNPSTPGNFRIVAYADSNGNGQFDEGEQVQVLQIAVVRVTLQPGSGVVSLSNTLYPDTFSGGFVGVSTAGHDLITNEITSVPMTLTGLYLVEGGGADRLIGPNAIRLGDVGNLLGDSLMVDYPGTSINVTDGTDTESPGGPVPMLDTSNPMAGAGLASVFRGSSVAALRSSPPGGGVLLEISGSDGPAFDWLPRHPRTTNGWGTTQGGYSFREAIVGVSSSMIYTYVPYAQAKWVVNVVGFNANEWVDSGSAVSGDATLGALTSPNLQILGVSFFMISQAHLNSTYQP